MKLEIYDKYTRKRLNMIKVYSYASYEDEYNSYGNFSIIMYPDENVVKHIVFGNYILFDDSDNRNVVGIIKGIKHYEEDDVQIEVFGYLSNIILTYRYFLLTTRYNDLVVNIITQMFKDLFIESVRPERNIEFLKLQDESTLPVIDEKILVQNTGKNFLDVFNDKFGGYGLGIDLFPIIENYDEEKGKTANLDCFELRINESVDRTIDNKHGNVPVVFSFDLNNLSDLSYNEDGREYANVAIVASEGTGTSRKIIEIGDTEATGIDRIELYVDARDLQSGQETTGGGNTGGGGSTKPDEPEEPGDADLKIYNLFKESTIGTFGTVSELNAMFNIPEEIRGKIKKVFIKSLILGVRPSSNIDSSMTSVYFQMGIVKDNNNVIKDITNVSRPTSSAEVVSTLEGYEVDIEGATSVNYFRMYKEKRSGSGYTYYYRIAFDIDLYYEE